MLPFSIEELRLAARRRLPRSVFDFIDGGAEDERTLRENRAAFERVRLMPRDSQNPSGLERDGMTMSLPSEHPVATSAAESVEVPLRCIPSTMSAVRGPATGAGDCAATSGEVPPRKRPKPL